MRWLLIFLLASCARAPLTDSSRAFLPAESPPALADSYSLDSFREALSRNLAAKSVPAQYVFAGRVVLLADYRRALEALRAELTSWDHFHEFVRANFDFYPVYGGEREGEVLSTGYYDGTLKGSRKKSAAFTEPLYRTPFDMVSVDLRAFSERMPDVKPLQSLVLEQKAKSAFWRGRVTDDHRVVPYFSRSEIQRNHALEKRGLEIVYVDPVDAFFLEIQGSGTVELEGGKRIRVGYDGQNGAPYTAIGKFLWDTIPKDQMSMQRIRWHLAGLNRDQQQDLFDQNASYVFFKEVKGEALTYSGADATAMRTVASDQGLYPKGTLEFFAIDEPVVADRSNEKTVADKANQAAGEGAALDPIRWESRPRWVFDQDTGGAIRGGGRVDLFTGRGPDAERVAGVMKRVGHLWAVAPKAEFLQQLSATPR
jgi:membrane-bound lytic murein transglycosylase A